MRCGGCGSKVGATVLKRALRRVKSTLRQQVKQGLLHGNNPLHRPEVVAGLDSPDDAALIRPPPPGHLLVQTVDFFRTFIPDPFVFGKVAANHALSDCHAMNGDAVSALAIIVLPFGKEASMEDDLVQVLSGACQAFAECGEF